MNDLSKIPTRDLVDELKKREGVSDWPVDPYIKYYIYIGDGRHDMQIYVGPARILVVTD